MKIAGKAHCFFEQSGTFKNEFIRLGIPAEDYDIQNNFGETDHVVDLFKHIEDAYDGQPSLFDGIVKDDIIMAFFPCIYFCESSQCAFRIWHFNYKTWPDTRKIAAILEREQKRSQFYRLLVKLVGVCLDRGIRIVIENPYTMPHYLAGNFLKDPDLVDRNRALRGDNLKKPTAYWFFNCQPTHGVSAQPNVNVRKIRDMKSGAHAGLCSEERSTISPNYARNFICDFLLGGGADGRSTATRHVRSELIRR